MSSYAQLWLEERCSIVRLREAGQSIWQIASALDGQPSTIARELTRNSGNKVGYQPAYAHKLTNARRKPASRPTASLTAWPICSQPSHHRCARPSPSTMAASSANTSASAARSASNPTSAIPEPHGKKAASKTPSDASDAACPEKPTQQPCPPNMSTPSSAPATTHPENASPSKHPPKPSTRCTSNVNPHPGQARGDGGRVADPAPG